MTDTQLPTEEKNDNRKKKLIAAILLFLLLAFGILAFLFLQTPEAPVVEKPAPKPIPVHVETEQEKWVANLAALNAAPIPTFTCNNFAVMDQSITLADGTVFTMPMETQAEDSAFHFIQAPAAPTHEQLFPNKTNGVFERCALNVAVPYTESLIEGETVLSPDRSSIPAAVAPYGYVDASPTDSYAVDGAIYASTNLYQTTDTLADVFKREIEVSSTFRDGITVVTKLNSVVTTESEVISIAFSTDADLGNAPADKMLELRSQVSEEQYKVLNAAATEVLHPTLVIATEDSGVGIDKTTGDGK